MGLPSFPDQALVVSMPPSPEEVLMDPMVIVALLVAVFLGLGGLIYFGG